MTELVKIHEHKGQRIVSARDLHEYLEVGRDFSNWIKDRIEKYGFVENQDFVTFAKIVERAKRIEYGITIDMAKELSMVENNEKGRVARRYFIACEKQLKASIAIPQSFAEALMLAANQAKELEEKAKQLAIMAPKAEFADRVMDSGNLVDIGQAAKLLKLPFGRNTFFKHLREKGVFFKNRNEPKQEFIKRGYFELRETEVKRENHPDLIVTKILVKQPGLLWLSRTFGGNYNDSLPKLSAQ